MLRNFRFILPGQLAGMAHPGFRDQLPDTLRALAEQGVRAVVSVDEEGLPDDLLSAHEFAYRHFPVDDFCPPSIEQAEAFCRFVDEQVSQGTGVSVHCWAGIGRTGTMLAAYLVHKGFSAAEAIRRVRTRGGIESREQEDFLFEFEAVHRKGHPDEER